MSILLDAIVRSLSERMGFFRDKKELGTGSEQVLTREKP